MLYQVRGIEAINVYLSRRGKRETLIALRLFGAKVGEPIGGKYGVTIDNAPGSYANLRIGSSCYIGQGVFFDLVKPIVIEDEVVIAAQAMLLTHTDVGDRLLAKFIDRKEGSVHVGRGAYLGARAVIIPGVVLGEGSIVGAGAVVTKSVPPYSVVVGVPARIIKTLHPTQCAAEAGTK
jgi:acetyltransferase-like isoleucine patch superfamily enzyme